MRFYIFRFKIMSIRTDNIYIQNIILKRMIYYQVIANGNTVILQHNWSVQCNYCWTSICYIFLLFIKIICFNEKV